LIKAGAYKWNERYNGYELEKYLEKLVQENQSFYPKILGFYLGNASRMKNRVSVKYAPMANTINITHALRNVNNYLNTNICSYLETFSGQSSNPYLNVVHFFNASVN
jgi:hypothetical protein